MSDDKIEIYKVHVQSADKLDERRDVTVRTYGGVCGVIAALAASLILEHPVISIIMWGFSIYSCLDMEGNIILIDLKIDGKSKHAESNGRTTVSILSVLD